MEGPNFYVMLDGVEEGEYYHFSDALDAYYRYLQISKGHVQLFRRDSEKPLKECPAYIEKEDYQFMTLPEKVAYQRAKYPDREVLDITPRLGEQRVMHQDGSCPKHVLHDVKYHTKKNIFSAEYHISEKYHMIRYKEPASRIAVISSDGEEWKEQGIPRMII